MVLAGIFAAAVGGDARSEFCPQRSVHLPKAFHVRCNCVHYLIQCHGTSPPYPAAAQASTARWVLPAVIAARAMVGLGEGVALPAMNNLVSGRRQQHPPASSGLHISKAGTHT